MPQAYKGLLPVWAVVVPMDLIKQLWGTPEPALCVVGEVDCESRGCRMSVHPTNYLSSSRYCQSRWELQASLACSSMLMEAAVLLKSLKTHMENLEFWPDFTRTVNSEWQSQIGPSVYNENNFIGFEIKTFMKMKIFFNLLFILWLWI